MVLSALAPLPPDYESYRPLVMGAFLALGFTIAMVGAVGVALVVIARRAARLDEAFDAVGLQGVMYLQNGRAYHGTWGGRRVDAYCYRGPTVDIYVESPLHTRIGIGGRNVLAKSAAAAMGREELKVPGLEHRVVYPTEPTWAEALMAIPEACDLVERLTDDVDTPDRRILILGPDAVHLKLQFIPEEHITQEAVFEWVENLSEVARIGEELPPPEEHLEESAFERQVRVERGKMARRIGCLVAAFFGLVLVPAAVVVPLVVFLAMD
jgi:hypothetical protein